MTDLLARPRVSDECLSAWRISQYTLGLLETEERSAADEHISECGHCAQRLLSETADMRAAAYEEVPARLVAEKPPRPARLSWPWKAGGGLVLATAAAAALIAVMMPDRDFTAVRGKGGIAVSLAVLRDGVVVIEGVPIEDAPRLRPGDRLRVKVHGGQRAWVLLQGWEDEQWRTYFAGELPDDRWLPPGVRITSEGRTQLRVVLCPRTADGAAVDALLARGVCSERVVDL